EVRGPSKRLRETEQHERRQRPAQLERDDAVYLASEQEDEHQRHEAGDEAERRPHEGGHAAGSSDLRNGTRSCTSSERRSSSVSTTYAFGLNVAAYARHARDPNRRAALPEPGSKSRTMKRPRTISRRRRLTKREPTTMKKSTNTIAGTVQAAATSRTGMRKRRPVAA